MSEMVDLVLRLAPLALWTLVITGVLFAALRRDRAPAAPPAQGSEPATPPAAQQPPPPVAPLPDTLQARFLAAPDIFAQLRAERELAQDELERTTPRFTEEEWRALIAGTAGTFETNPALWRKMTPGRWHALCVALRVKNRAAPLASQKAIE